MLGSAIYFLLYVSGVYTLVVFPPIRAAIITIAEPLRLAIADDVARVPLVLRCVIALVIFDLLAYWMHRAAHAVPLLWRVHRVHHGGPALGPLTTFRFHIVEIAWRMALQFLPLYVLGIAAAIPDAAWGVLVAFNVLAHSDLEWTFGAAGRAVVSPAYHRAHHRGDAANYGMFLTAWDALFRTRATN